MGTTWVATQYRENKIEEKIRNGGAERGLLKISSAAFACKEDRFNAAKSFTQLVIIDLFHR
jgi:hypothetical protein